jgi:hypothetical protein
VSSDAKKKNVDSTDAVEFSMNDEQADVIFLDVTMLFSLTVLSLSDKPILLQPSSIALQKPKTKFATTITKLRLKLLLPVVDTVVVAKCCCSWDLARDM